MPSRIAGGLSILCTALLMSQPVHAAEPTFSDLLARAQAEADAGHRLEPPGDNLADTIMALFKLAPTATSQQLAAFSDLLERDRKQQQNALATPPTPAAPSTIVPPSAASVTPSAIVPPSPGVPAPVPPRDAAVPRNTAVSRDTAVPRDTVAPRETGVRRDTGVPRDALAPRDTAVRGPDAHAAELFSRGETAERSGDISAARRFYASAAARGSAIAARDLGRLYDPAFLGRTVIGGVDPDPAAARRWYERATELGDREAAPLLQALNAR